MIEVSTLADSVRPAGHPRAYLVITFKVGRGVVGPLAFAGIAAGIFSEASPTSWRSPIVVATAGVFRNTYDDSDDYAECEKALREWCERAHPGIFALLPPPNRPR